MKKIIKPIKIRDLYLKNNLFLAPMEGFTNVAFRTSLLDFEEGMTFTEMIPSNAFGKDSNYCNYLTYRNDKEVIAYQLFGNNLKNIIKSMKNIENKADMFNLNLGCPSEKIIKQGAGCALLKRKNKIYEIVKEMRKTTKKPITLKIRIGYVNKSHLDYDLLYSLGCDGIFIHARTCKQKYSGNIDFDYLKEAKEKSQIPIIANGDIKRFEDVLKIYNYSKVDGFMIGRAVLHNPKVFKDIYNEKDYVKWATTMNIKEKIVFLKKYYNNLKKYNLKNPFIKIKSLSMFLFRYCKDAKKVRNELIKIKEINVFWNFLNKIED